MGFISWLYFTRLNSASAGRYPQYCQTISGMRESTASPTAFRKGSLYMWCNHSSFTWPLSSVEPVEELGPRPRWTVTACWLPVQLCSLPTCQDTSSWWARGEGKCWAEGRALLEALLSLASAHGPSSAHNRSSLQPVGGAFPYWWV